MFLRQNRDTPAASTASLEPETPAGRRPDRYRCWPGRIRPPVGIVGQRPFRRRRILKGERLRAVSRRLSEPVRARQVDARSRRIVHPGRVGKAADEVNIAALKAEYRLPVVAYDRKPRPRIRPKRIPGLHERMDERRLRRVYVLIFARASRFSFSGPGVESHIVVIAPLRLRPARFSRKGSG